MARTEWKAYPDFAKMSEILQFCSDETLSEYDRLREDAILFDLQPWTLFELKGDDRKAWLQGQVTNDIRSFIAGSSSSFCICKTTGQIEAVLDAWALSDRFCLVCRNEEAQSVARRVAEMVILEDVALNDVTADFRRVSLQGPRATARLAELIDLPNLDSGVTTLGEDAIRVLRCDRTGSGGWDLWVPHSADGLIERLSNEVGFLGEEGYEIARIEAGIPAPGVDYDAKTLPPELGDKFVGRHVNYSKGCYTGQEVLMRIHSRGHTNRSWVGLLLDNLPEAGSSVTHPIRGEVGVVTSRIFSPEFGPIATAWVKNEFSERGQELNILSQGVSLKGEVRPLPFFASV